MDTTISTCRTGGKNAAATISGSALSIGRYAIPFRVPGSQRDRQILHYFCVQGAREIASLFNVDFWTNTVLQHSHQESVVRQALVSLSSLHLAYTTKAVPGTDDTRHEAIARYGRAIQALRRRIEKPTHEITKTVKTALMCCILFYCFEAALGDSVAAIRHLDSGLDLLSTHCHRRELEDTDDLNQMSRILEGLDLQATTFDDGRVPRLLLSTEVLRDTAAFQSLYEAWWAFTRLQNLVFRFLTTKVSYKFCEKDSTPSFVLKEKCLLLEHFDAWMARFEQSDFLEDDNKQQDPGAKVLLIQWNVSKMLLEANYPTNDSVFGASPNPWADRVLDMARDVLGHCQWGDTNLDQGSVAQRRRFSSESGIVASLFILSARCSDESVCDRALDLLTMSRRREGLYDAGSMVDVLHRFRTARQQKIMQSNEPGIENSTRRSLEAFFRRQIEGVVGGMDKLADGLKSELPTT